MLISAITFFAPLSAKAAELYFPPSQGDWEKADPAKLGWNEAQLQKAIDLTCMTNGTALLVVQAGRIVAEHNCSLSEDEKTAFPKGFWRIYKGATATGAPIEEVASIQKSLVSFLVGIAAGKGLVDIEKPASVYLGKGWSKATPEQEAAITVRHLLAMSSGLDNELRYQKPVNTQWFYNVAAYARLLFILEKVTGKTMPDLTKEWLFDPAGMHDSAWEKRGQEGRFATTGSPYGFVTTPRDLARFGLVVMNGGVWNGKDLLNNPGWMEKSTMPSQNSRKSYGFLWWLNGHDYLKAGSEDAGITEELIPAAPDDLFAAQGGSDRRLYVVPSLSLVVVRMGGPAGGNNFDMKLWWYLMRALPTLARPSQPN